MRSGVQGKAEESNPLPHCARDARSVAFQSIVRDAETLTIGLVIQCTTIGTLDDVVCHHHIATLCTSLTALALLYPFAAPTSTVTHHLAPSPVLWPLKLGISLLWSRARCARIMRSKPWLAGAQSHQAQS